MGKEAKKTQDTQTVEMGIAPISTTVVKHDSSDVVSNGVITVSKTELANAVGFDYEKHIQLLTPAERKEHLAKADSINESDITSVQMYGSEISKTISENGDMLLDSVRANNSNNEANILINDLLAELKMVDVDDLSSTKLKRFLCKIPGIRQLIMSADKIIIKYDTIKNNVDQISNRIRQHKIIAERDNNVLEIIFDNNCKYIDELREYIIAAKLKNEQITERIDYMISRPTEFAPIVIHDAQNFQHALEKRIADMQIMEYIFNQDLFRIRAIQSGNMSLSNQAESIATTVIPMWKSQLAMAVILLNQQNTIERHKKINKTTNELLIKNAQLMKTNSISVAKANEEQVVSLDTLKETTKSLIETITEVQKIQKEGAKMRETLEHNLVEYGTQLTNKINELSVGAVD